MIGLWLSEGFLWAKVSIADFGEVEICSKTWQNLDTDRILNSNREL